jgi:hypothetical protein
MTFLQNLLNGFTEISKSFVHDWSIWWVLAPVFLIWTIVEIYFGMYKKEELGWNTSLAHGITLMWISVDSIRHTFNTEVSHFWVRFIVTLCFLLYGLFLIYVCFKHRFSEKVTFHIASPNLIFFLAISVILFTYGELTLSIFVILDLVIIFILVILVTTIVKKLMPQSQAELDEEFKPNDSIDDVANFRNIETPGQAIPKQQDTGIPNANQRPR